MDMHSEPAGAGRRAFKRWSRAYRLHTRLAACFFLVALASLLPSFLEMGGEGAYKVWIANGVLLSYLLLAPRWRWPAYLLVGFAALMLGDLLAAGAWHAYILPVAALNIVEVLICALLLKKRSTQLPLFANPAYLVRFLCFAVVAGPLASGPALALLAPLLHHQPFWPTYLSWIAFDGLGIAVTTPAFVALLQSRLSPAADWKRNWPWPLLFAAVTVAGFLLPTLPLMFLIYPLLLLVLIRLGIAWAGIATLFLEVFGSWCTLHGIGPFTMPGSTSSTGSSLQMQGFVAIGMFLVYAASVLLEKHQALEQQLQDVASLHAMVTENSRDAIVMADFTGKCTYLSAAVQSIAGWRPEELMNTEPLRLIHPEDLPRIQDAVRESKSGVDGATIQCRIRTRDGHYVWTESSLRLIRSPRSGAASGVLCIVRDITENKRAELQLRESEQRYRTTFEQAAVGMVHASFDGKILRSNARFAEILGYTQEEIVGLTFQQLTAPENLPASVEAHEQVAGGVIPSAILEKRYIRKDGSLTWVKIALSTQRDSDERPLHFIVLVEDINALKEAGQHLAAATEAMRLSESRYRTVFHTTPESVAIEHLSDGRLIDVNRTFLEITGYRSDEIIGRSALKAGVWANDNDRNVLIEMLLHGAECHELEFQLRRKNGEIFWARMSASLIEIEGTQCVLSFARDISEAKAAEDEIRNLAFYDSLTGLPNRRLLAERLRQTMAASTRSHRKGALLFIDLDGFKMLNDTLGHKTGDAMLQEVARRLTACVRDSDTVARWGGDEFVIILEELSEGPEDAASQAKIVAEKILAAIRRTYQLAGRDCVSASSIGITIFGDQRGSIDDVLQQADIAMYHAKAAGRNTLRFFAPALQSAINTRAAMEEDLREALKNRQFVLYIQPQVDSGQLVGVETLLRWNHPTRGVLEPDQFIALAEETGLILPLGDWVLESACAQIASWVTRKETAHLTVAVNISARQLRQPEFVEHVLNVLYRTGANPRNLYLELTESMLVDNVEDLIAKMAVLKSHGLRFSLDDFGTGYSSLSYLKRLPLDQLKIDLVFVRDMLVDVTSGAIAQTVVSLSRVMGLSVIAEGVETEQQRAFLAALGCHSIQGYLVSRPLPLDTFDQWLVHFSRNGASKAIEPGSAEIASAPFNVPLAPGP
jgi:diguanylate cyclase (GGDEF)-like protein/PAS domain S-box-containing protein